MPPIEPEEKTSPNDTAIKSPDKTIEDAMAKASHEIRNPLHGLQGSLEQILIELKKTPNTDSTLIKVETIKSSVKEITENLTIFLDVAKSNALDSPEQKLNEKAKEFRKKYIKNPEKEISELKSLISEKISSIKTTLIHIKKPITELNNTELNETLVCAQDTANKLEKLYERFFEVTNLADLSLKNEIFEVKEFMGKLKGQWKAMARERKLQINDEIKLSENNFYIKSDSLIINAILDNLISNAIKNTSEGGTIILGMNITYENETSAKLKFTVKDTGCGLTQEQISKLFHDYAQTEDTIKKKEGTGLGLVNTKTLLNKLKGEIDIQSTPGDGSSFMVTISCEKPSPEEIYAHEHPPETKPTQEKIELLDHIKGRTVLIAEDDKVNQKIFKKMLTDLGVKCEIANNGQEACLKAKASHAIIFMDDQMPEMNDGLTATKTLRERGFIMPIISTSGAVTTEYKIAAKEAGATACLSKPFTQEDVIKILNMHVKPCTQTEKSTPSSRPSSMASFNLGLPATPPTTRRRHNTAPLLSRFGIMPDTTTPARKLSSSFPSSPSSSPSPLSYSPHAAIADLGLSIQQIATLALENKFESKAAPVCAL